MLEFDNVELLTYTTNPESRLLDYYSQCYKKPISLKNMLNVLKHESVLEHISYTFRINCSRLTHLQIVRHRLASYTSQSHRYTTISCADTYKHIPNEIKDLGYEAVLDYINDCIDIYNKYIKWIDKGVSKESARYLINDGCNIEFTVTMNLRELLHFFALRTDVHAQDEIKELANNMKALVFETLPDINEVLNTNIERKKL